MKATESRFHGGLLVPLRQLTVNLDASVTTPCNTEPQSQSSQTVLALGEQDVAAQEGIEGSSIHTGKYRMLDTVV